MKLSTEIRLLEAAGQNRDTNFLSLAPTSLSEEIGPIRPRFGQSSGDRNTSDPDVQFHTAEPKKPLLQLKPANSLDASGWDIQKRYEGVVISLRADRVLARFKENPGDFPEVESEFVVEEIPKAQREFLREGALLVWTIGYATDKSGSKRRQSQFYIRRIVRPSSTGKQVASKISAIVSALRWE